MKTLVLLACLLLTACGGGGDDSEEDARPNGYDVPHHMQVRR